MVVRLGLIGCGEVAMACHLPALLQLKHLFEVTAVCDVSKGAMEYCSSKYGPFRMFESSNELLALLDIDAVFILNSDEFHAPVAAAAARFGKHIFLEKPMALTRKSCEQIIEAKNKHGVKVMVEYMRRYDAAFQQAVKIIGGIERISYARVRDIIGPNAFFVGQSGTFPQKFDDIPEDAITSKNRMAGWIASDALGSHGGDKDLARIHRFLGSLGSHDLSVMREALGMPKRCIAAACTTEPSIFLNAIFQYDGFNLTYETGIDDVNRFDAHLEVYGGGKVVRINWDSPYVAGLPTTLTVQGTDEHGQYYETVTRGSYISPYTTELELFHEALVNNGPIKTTPEDAVNEVDIFKMVTDALIRDREAQKVAVADDRGAKRQRDR